MDAGQKISRLLADRLWSQAALAQRASINPATLNAIVRGNIPRVNNAIAIARALEVPVDWLFDDFADEPPPADAHERPFLSDSELRREAETRLDALVRDRRTATRTFQDALRRWNSQGLDGDQPDEVQKTAQRLWSLHDLLNTWRFSVGSILRNPEEPVAAIHAANACLGGRFAALPSGEDNDSIQPPESIRPEPGKPPSPELLRWYVRNALDEANAERRSA